MAKIWRNRIEAGTQEFSNCPAKYKNDVLKLMRDDVEEGIITKEQFEEMTGEEY